MKNEENTKKTKINILHLDDSDIASDFIKSTLQNENLNFNFFHVYNKTEFQEALERKIFDLILVDYTLPDYDGISALHYSKEKIPAVPVIIISGTIDEEVAIEALHQGATDYIFKQRAKRLGSAVRRALVESENKKKQLEAENALKDSEEKYRMLIEQSDEAIFLIYDHEFEVVNKKFTNIFGIDARQANELKFEIINLIDPVDRIPIQDQLDGLLNETDKERELGFEFKTNGQSGKLIFIEAVISRIKYKSGTAIQGIFRDISEKKQLFDQLLQIQKMEAIGNLAGGVAHDFNNLLTVINGYTEIILADLEKDHPLYENIIEIKKAGSKAEELTHQLLAFSRKQEYKTKILGINAIVKDMEKMLHRLIGEDIEMTLTLGESLPKIKADKAQLEQIFMNLVVNSRDAVNADHRGDREKMISIETGYSAFMKNGSLKHPDMEEGEFIYISVSDNGIGMDEETKSKIFEPFFTTKEKHKGTGLGLATVYGIIKQNKGNIYVYSEPGKGTTFKIYWPVTKEEPEQEKGKNFSIDYYSGNESILIVEDDNSVCKFASEALKSLGYTVFCSPNGKKALEHLEKDQYVYDLIITDMVMPELNGKEFIGLAKNYLPHSKVIFTSGYTENFILNQESPGTEIHFINKPYSFHTLAEKIRKVLDSK